MPRRLFFLLLAFACLQCSGKAGTFVQVNLSYSDEWHLDYVRLAMSDNESQVAVQPKIRLRLPRELAGQVQRLTVDGLANGERIAHGTVEFTPVANESIIVFVTLARLPCGAWCVAGTTRCFGDGAAVCEQRDDDGCMEWSEPVLCGEDAPSCSLGECRDKCIDECAEGETRCDGPAGVLECGQGDSDSCWDWVEGQTCAGGTTCVGGACAEVCQDACSLGETRCLGQGFATCGDANGDGCLEWGPEQGCPDGQTCSGDSCQVGCTDDCTDSACTGLQHRACGQFDLDPCKDLSPGVSCIAKEPCRQGLCDDSAGCSDTALVCNDAPEDFCIDPDTKRVFEPQGICQDENGRCSYDDFTDIPCENCPACSTSCVPATCDELGYQCGVASDDCGGTVDCGSCGLGEECDAASHVCMCAPSAIQDIDVIDGGDYVGFAVAQDGTLHMTVSDGRDLLYRKRQTDGTWSAPALVWSDPKLQIYQQQVHVDETGKPHVVFVFLGNASARYAKEEDGSWVTEAVGPTRRINHVYGLKFLRSKSGALHVFRSGSWFTGEETYYELWHSRRPAVGEWVSSEWQRGASSQVRIDMDSGGILHRVFPIAVCAGGDTYSSLDHETWAPDGSHTGPRYLALRHGCGSAFQSFDIAVRADDTPVVAYAEYATDATLLRVSSRPLDTWTEETLTTGDNVQLAEDSLGGLHLLYETEDTLRHAHRPAGSLTWEYNLIAASVAKRQAWIGADGVGGVHVVYRKEDRWHYAAGKACR